MTLKWNSLISLKDDSHVINKKHVVHLLLSINTRKINAIYTKYRTTEANNGYLSIYLPKIIKKYKNTTATFSFFPGAFGISLQRLQGVCGTVSYLRVEVRR